MKIAVTGKGGCGKTMLAGALSCHLADRGHHVVAVDADPNPNLGVALGLPAVDVEDMDSILTGLQASGHTHHDPTPEPDELVTRFGLRAPGGVDLVATGKIEAPNDSCLCCGSHATTRRFFGDLPAQQRVVIADLEAGLNDLIWAQPGADDVVVVVADRSAKAVDVAARAAHVAAQMGVQRIVAVANRSHGDGDAHQLGEATGVPAMAIPEDSTIGLADRQGVAAFDTDAESPAMAAIGELADTLVGAGV
jgi:CO dehydrogenase maturation factor